MQYRTRELTQSQTIQQNQVERLSDHFFKKGAMAIREISYDLNYYAIKISSLTGTSNLTDLVGATFTGSSSGIQQQ